MKNTDYEYTLEELKEKLSETHEVTVFFASPATYKMRGMQLTQSRRTLYKVTANVLADMMASLAAGKATFMVYGKRYNFSSREWTECYDTIVIANVASIEWPERMLRVARAMHEEEIQREIDVYFGEGDGDAEETTEHENETPGFEPDRNEEN